MTVDKTATTVLTQSLYPLAIALCLFPFVDMAGRLLPLHLGNVQWRFGAVGLLFGGTLVMFLIGLTLLAFVAASRQQAKVLYATAVVAILMAVVLTAALVVFSLDALQVRSAVRDELKASMASSAISAALGAVLTIAGVLGVAVGAIRAQRSLERRSAAVERVPLVASP